MGTIIVRRRTVRDLGLYADQSGADDALVIPEDLSTLTDDELAALSERAATAFDALYGDGSTGLSDDDVAILADLTTGIEALAAETERRESAAEERRATAAALAARVHGEPDEPEEPEETQPETPEPGETPDEPDEPEEPEETEPEEPVEELVAATRGPLSINLAAARKRAPRQTRSQEAAVPSMRDVAYTTSDTLGFAANAAVDFHDAGSMLQRRLNTFSLSQYQAASVRNQHIREQHSLMAFKRPIPKDLIVASSSPEEMAAAMDRAVDQSRLPGGTLTAAGWCAPSEVLYDLCYNESRDGLLSLPEVNVTRGGIKVPVNPSFADLYSKIGFHFTEADAEAGKWAPGPNPGDPNVVGDKPCYEVECPDWEDYRLSGDGVCITADFLQMRGYPEMLARVTQGALIAHDHKVSAGHIAQIVAGSTAVTMTTGTVGTTAPLLAAIELQVEHYRYTQRLSRATLLEGIFPFWVHGAIRQDLSVRLGLALFDVTDAMIDAWFRLRGLVPQYVYDWQAIDATDADDFTQWPDTVDFLLYQAGTWVAGVDDIITLDSVYDSTMLGQNRFIALFTEEASLVAKRCVDSRVITVPVCSDGSTHAGVLLDCDLAPTAEAA
jgi:hypothetical protein